MSSRPFRVLGLQQVAIGGPSKARLRALWVDLLGLEVTGSFRSERENVDEDICALGGGVTKVEVDLMEPIDPNGKPAVHLPPLRQAIDSKVASRNMPASAFAGAGTLTAGCHLPASRVTAMGTAAKLSM